jgi:hypothetical protein
MLTDWKSVSPLVLLMTPEINCDQESMSRQHFFTVHKTLQVSIENHMLVKDAPADPNEAVPLQPNTLERSIRAGGQPTRSAGSRPLRP